MASLVGRSVPVRFRVEVSALNNGSPGLAETLAHITPGQQHEDGRSTGGKYVADTAPLAGFRVLELGHYVAAPFATRLLADLGTMRKCVVLAAEGGRLR